MHGLETVRDWPSDAALFENDHVTTQRKPFFVGRVCGWYRNADGRLGYCVEADAIPGLIHIYPATALAPSHAS